MRFDGEPHSDGLKRKQRLMCMGRCFFTFTVGILFTDTKLFLSDDGTVAVDVGADKIIQQTTTFTYQHFKSALSGIIFVI